MNGTIFDLKEFALNDGPGVRLTVFFKGCPLRCRWCHNPEGWTAERQILHRGGRDIPCGDTVTPEELAEKVLRQADILRDMGGGVTFSGGEPLMQPAFLFAVCGLLPGVHRAIETCGYAPEDVFREMCALMDLIYMDVKILDPALHEEMTGVSNAPILRNLSYLKEQETPFIIRMPLIPGVTDTEGNYRALAEALQGAKHLVRAELLPYNRLAGAKYGQLGLRYAPCFDEKKPVVIRQDILRDAGIESEVR